MEINELERKFVTNNKGMTAAEFSQMALYYWELFETAGARDRIKIVKKAAYYAVCAFKFGETNPDKLKIFISILDDVVKIHTFPGEFARDKTKIIKKLKELGGGKKTSVLKEIKGKVQVESGMVGVGDSSFNINFKDYKETEFVEIIKKGEYLFFRTGGDGDFGAKLRFVTGDEPIAQDEEYKHIIFSSGIYNINFPSGKVRLSDLHHKDDEGNGLTMEVYKVAVYTYDVPEKYFGFITVMSKTTEAPTNKVEKLDVLG